MIRAQATTIREGVVQYALFEGQQLSYRKVIELWCNSPAFRSFYIGVLKASAFDTYRWETPPVTTYSLDKPFEFVLINHPGLAAITDRMTFRQYFTSEEENAGIVTFDNLGRDARLIVPSPLSPPDAFNHLAMFTRTATAEQNDALWKAVGEAMTTRVGGRPIWLNTAGDGVSWLHIRLDNRPKYYRYGPYTIVDC